MSPHPESGIAAVRQCPGEADQLLLSGRKALTALPHRLREPLRKGAHKIEQIYVARPLPRYFLVDTFGAQADV